MNRKEVIALVGTVHALWPNFEATEHTVTAWLAMLEDTDFDLAMGVVMVHSSDGERFAPLVGQVRKAAVGQAGALAPDVDEALDEVMRRVRAHGWTYTPEEVDWSHPAIHAAVRALGGWREVCLSENPEAFRAHFRQFYGTAAQRTDRVAAMAPAAALALDQGTGRAVSALDVGGTST